MNGFPQGDFLHLQAAQGWLGLSNHLEANEELEKINPLLHAHPDTSMQRPRTGKCALISTRPWWSSGVGPMNGYVYALAVSGSDLYAGGYLYKVMPDTASATTTPLVPEPSAAQLFPSHLAMLVAPMSPGVEKLPPAFRLVPETASANTERGLPPIPEPSADQPLPSHLATR